MSDHQKSASPEQQVRLIIWAIPRSTSSVLAKCLSHVDDTQTFFEPYLCAHLFGPDQAPPNSSDAEFEKRMSASREKVDEMITEGAVPGFDENMCSYKWVKEQLEAPYPGKRFIFCKDIMFTITEKLEFIPKGYRHMFLVRHPLRVFPSWKKLFHFVMDAPLDSYRLDEMPNRMFPPGYGFKEISELTEYVRKTHDPDPIIMDADDLLQDPKDSLTALFKTLGLSFDEKFLHWDAGDAITKQWVTSRVLMRANKMAGYYKEALASSCFLKPSPLPDRSSVSAEMLQYVDASMPYYEKMLAQRLKPTP